MQIIEPQTDIADFLQCYEESDVVLEFVFISRESDVPLGDEKSHQHAANLGLRFVQKKWDDCCTINITDDEFSHINNHRAGIPTDYLPNGQPISVDEFIGPRNSRSDGFQQRSQNGFYYGSVSSGFAFALMEPPHGIKNPRECFLEFKRVVFSDFPDEMTVYAWETDGPSYFDAGREFWGTFFWTVQVSSKDPIMAIFGSTTD